MYGLQDTHTEQEAKHRAQSTSQIGTKYVDLRTTASKRQANSTDPLNVKT